MATSANSWMPTHGRHHVNIGTSLGRALKARKLKGAAPPAAAATKRSNLPDRDFYSFRYNFKPPSIDATRPGTIEVQRGSVTVEHPSSQSGEGHVFVGAEHPAKEWECVLIYDEETGTFTLEKLDSYMILTYQRKMAINAARPAASPPPPPPAAETSKSVQRTLNYDEVLERDLLGEDEDAHGEVDDEFEEAIPDSIAYREEEEEEEEEAYQPEPQPSPPPPKLKLARSAKAAPAPAPTPTPTPAHPVAKARPEPARQIVPLPSKPIKQAGAAAPKPKKARPPILVAPQAQPLLPPAAAAPPAQQQHLSDTEEEDLEFGKPATKRVRRSPQPNPPPASTPASSGLALPGGADTTYAPPLQPSYSTETPHDSESDEDWDEVQPHAEADVDVFGDHFGGAAADDGEGEEIDVNAFERELNMQMEESDAENEDDFLMAAVSPEPDGDEGAQRVPLSLKELAGGTAFSDDEYSSSEESDEE